MDSLDGFYFYYSIVSSVVQTSWLVKQFWRGTDGIGRWKVAWTLLYPFYCH